MIIIYCISDFINIYHTNEGMNSIEPPNELRNHVHLRNLALIHVALITSLMQRIAGSVVTNDRHHGARRGIYGAHEFYTQPNPVANPN